MTRSRIKSLLFDCLRNTDRNSKHLESKLFPCTQLLCDRSFINATAFTLRFLLNWGARLKCPTWLVCSSLYCKNWLDKETLTPREVMGQSAASHTQTINYSYVAAESSASTVQTGTVSCHRCHIHIFVSFPQFSSPYFRKEKHDSFLIGALLSTQKAITWNNLPL